MCDEGEVWSRGGACFSSNKAIGTKFINIPPINLANTGTYSFVIWFKL